MEKKVFVYKVKFSYWVFLPAAILIGFTLYCFFFNTGIGIKRLVLPAPYSYMITAVLGAIASIYAFNEYKSYKNSTQNSNNIEVNEDGVVFPYKKSVRRFAFKDINELYEKNDEDDGESFILYIDNEIDGKKRYEFFHDNFESTQEYLEFKTAIEQSA